MESEDIFGQKIRMSLVGIRISATYPILANRVNSNPEKYALSRAVPVLGFICEPGHDV